MSTPLARLPDRAFRSLARGRPDAAALAALRRGQLHKRRVLLAAVRAAAVAPSAEAVRSLDLAAAAGEEALLQPYVDAWAAEALRRLYGREPGEPDWAALPALLAPAPGRSLLLGGRRLRVEESGRFRLLHGHPPAEPPPGPAELARWQRVFDGAARVLTERHPRFAPMVRQTLSVVVPLQDPGHGQELASSVRRGYGAVALSPPRSPERLACSLVHETLHILLGALLDLVPLHGPAVEPRYPAPWRGGELRPAGALLQGVYAHFGVAAFWAEEAGDPRAPESARAARRAARWRTHAHEAALALLQGAELTTEGVRFTTALARELAALR